MSKVENAVLIWGPVSSEGINYLRFQGKEVVVCENRPYLLGLIHNKPLLEKEGFRIVYCPDNAIGHLFYKNAVREVVLFCRKEKGIIKGISGSLYVWLLAKLHSLPVKIFQQAEINWDKIKDLNASTLEGNLMVESGNIEPVEIEAIEL